MKLYVGNLPYSVDNDELNNIFSQYGEVESATIINDRQTGRSKGFGFVEMNDDSDAQSAIDALNDTDLNGRNIKVNEARPREERPQRNNRRRY